MPIKCLMQYPKNLGAFRGERNKNIATATKDFPPE